MCKPCRTSDKKSLISRGSSQNREIALPRRSSLLVCALSSILLATAHGQVNGVGAKPYQGWSSWTQESRLGEGWLTDAEIHKQADALVSTGLLAHGYNYVNIDAGWASNSYDSNGIPTANPTKFPNGLQSLVTYIHSKGERAGIYWLPGIPQSVYSSSDLIAGTNLPVHSIGIGTEAGNALPFDDKSNPYDWVKIDFTKPGAQEYVTSIVDRFASWGFDFVKLDFVVPGSNYNSLIIDNRPDVAAWSKAMAPHKMWLTLSNSLDYAYASDWEATSNARRIDTDVECYCSTFTNWSHVSNRFSHLVQWETAAGPQKGWNDLDSLDVGVGYTNGLTEDERQSVTSFWAIAGAPLYVGDDLTQLDAFGTQLLTNDSILAVDQSQHPGVQLAGGTDQIWATPKPGLTNGAFNVALFNLDSNVASTITVNLSTLGISGSADVCDLWTGADLGTSSGTFTSASLNPHASALVRMTPSAAPASPVRCGHRYLIVNENSKQAMDDNNFSTAVGTPLQQYTANGGTNQQWDARPIGTGWAFVNVASGLVLDIPGMSNQENVQVDQAKQTGSLYQQWNVIPVGDGTYEIQSVADGLALDVRGASLSPGAAIIQYPYHNGANQHWTFQLVQ